MEATELLVIAALEVPILGVGVWITLRIRRYRRELATVLAWPAQRATIVGSEIGSRYISRVGTQYWPVVTYDYEVGGRRYRSTRIAVGAAVSHDRLSVAERRLAPYPVGAVVEVFVDPADPTQSVLERTIPQMRTLQALRALLVIVAILAVPAIMAAW